MSLFKIVKISKIQGGT